MYFMTTSRLGFRHWTAEDIDLAMSLWGDPDVTALFDSRGPLTRDQVQARLDRERRIQADFGVQYWPFFLRETDEFVGCSGLQPYDVANGLYKTGFHLRRKFWGAGYASEAARAVIDYAFETIKPTAIMAGHNPRNHASKRVLEKLGFHYVRDEYFEGMQMMHPLYELRAAT
jgi:[ribosomal protein S5]-alanine N-acetyltransferase